MAEVSNKLWHGEYIKAEIEFTPSSTYVVYNNPALSEDGSFIKEIRFRFSEGNNRVNPLGVATSNTVSLQIYDSLDRLSPINEQSPYHNYIVNGIKIRVSISYDGTTWKNYGTYYTTSWSGSFSDGWHGLVSVGAEDILNTVGNLPMPEVEAFYSSTISQILAGVLPKLNIEGLTFKVSPEIEQQLGVFIANGQKVRDFLNNLCQLILARVVVDREGALNFIPALGYMLDYKTLTLSKEFTGALTNQNSSNINYNAIKVKYLEGGEISRAPIVQANQDLTKGKNKVTLNLSKQTLSVEALYISYENTGNNPEITEIDFTGSQVNLGIEANVENGEIPGASVSASGVIVSTIDREEVIPIPNTSIVGGTTFEFNTQQMMNKELAKQIAENLAYYIQTIQRVVSIKDTALTPELYTGDQIILQGTDTVYDGVYKITEINLTFSENYSMTLSLVRLGVINQ